MRAGRPRGVLTMLSLVCVGLMDRACQGKMIRNNALMNQMITHFHRENNLSVDPEPADTSTTTTTQRALARGFKTEEHIPEKVINLMQNFLCKNFPSIPCDIISQDSTLNKLIVRSIQQISKKKKPSDRRLLLERMMDDHSGGDRRAISVRKLPTPVLPEHKNPVMVNSEDLSRFLSVSNTGYFKPKASSLSQKRRKKKIPKSTTKKYWSPEHRQNKSRIMIDSQRNEVYSTRKKIRKFYPHKLKYKDKKSKSQGVIREHSDEKISISVEVPDVKLPSNKEHMTFKVDMPESPVWRIDYMKHGVPSFNMFGFEDERLMGKLIKNGGNTNGVMADDEGMPTNARKDVLHPDVYIKKNFARKKSVDMNSDDLA